MVINARLVMPPIQPSPVRVAHRYLSGAQPASDQVTKFLTGFYKRHIALGRFRPKVLEKQGTGSREPWASQVGDDIYLYQKFWELRPKERDHAFAHELGHWVSTQVGTSKLVSLANEVGIDPWDSGSLPYGQFNMEEAFAESFAEVHLNPVGARREQPLWARLVDEMVDAL